VEFSENFHAIDEDRSVRCANSGQFDFVFHDVVLSLRQGRG
jgi:hypothetical protein